MTDEAKQLVEDNMNLAYTIANKYYTSMTYLFDYDDIVSICFEALIAAANTFDTTRQVKFSTYAYNVIRNNLFSIYNWQKKKKENIIMISLDESQTDDEETLLSVLPDDIDLELDIVNNETVTQLYSYIEELPEELATIVKLHLKDMSFDTIAKIVSKSSAYVYTQYQKALNILRFKFKRGDNIGNR